MTKGINKQVIEIHDTGTQYFEKALLFVNPEYADIGEQSLREKFLTAFGDSEVPRSRKSRTRSILRVVLTVLFSAAAGALVTALIK